MLKPVCVITLAISLAACQPASSGDTVASAPSMAEPADAPAPATVTAPASGSEGASKVFGFVQAACGDCHAVETPGLSPNPKAPAFADIANRNGLTSNTLSTWLRDAHNYPEAMDFDLDTPQVGDITAYILTLRDANYKPPIY